MLNGVSGLEHLSNQLITERHSPSLNKIQANLDNYQNRVLNESPLAGSPFNKPDSPGKFYDKAGLQNGDPSYDPFYINE